MTLAILILAGGLGKRMNSDIPKVLHKLNNLTLIEHVINTALELKPNKIGIIVGKYKNQIKEVIDNSLHDYDNQQIEYINQNEPKGTGHAIQCATEFIKKYTNILILSGDVPLITKNTLYDLIHFNFNAAVSLLVNKLEDPTGYGRIVINDDKIQIVEEKDANEEQKLIKLINSGVYYFKSNLLLEHLPKLKNNNKQNEYYLTDLIKYYDIENCCMIHSKNNNEILGVNTTEQLNLLKSILLIKNNYLVGVVGLGFVGKSIYDSLNLKGCQIKGYDIDKKRSPDNFEDMLNCNILFLCLPTIYNEELKQYDKSNIEDICNKLEDNQYNGIVIIKSTVEPTTTEKLCNKFKTLQFIHNPEFLTAATAFYDFHNQTHIVLGKSINVSNNNVEYIKIFYQRYYRGIEISICTSNESECMKSFVNCFYSVKIQFFNELYLLCQKIGADYETIKKLMLRNGWINHMHTQVPGTDGKLSYGGYCFPKDTNALLQYMKTMDSPHEVLEATISERNKMRTDNDNVKKN